MASTELVFRDKESCAAALADVRNDATETNWAVWKYVPDSANDVQFHASGSGGIEELKSHLEPTDRAYAFLRVIDYVDNHPTVKFIFIVWVGERVNIIKKARMATHKGSISEFIGQWHVALDATDLGDLSEGELMSRVADASGSGSRVLQVGQAPRGVSVPAASAGEVSRPVPAASPASSFVSSGGVSRSADVAGGAPAADVAAPAAAAAAPAKKSGGSWRGGPQVATAASGVSFPDQAALGAAQAAVRSDSDPSDWCLYGYAGATNDLVVVGFGEGGIEALKSHLTNDSVNYGLVRVADFVDGHKTVKFVFIIWIGEGVKIMRKARIATHKGAITEFIGQYHTDITASSLDELTQDAIIRKVMEASGTAVHVK